MRCSKTGLNLPLEHFWVVSNFTYCRKQVQFTLRIHIIFPFVSFPVNSASNWIFQIFFFLFTFFFSGCFFFTICNYASFATLKYCHDFQHHWIIILKKSGYRNKVLFWRLWRSEIKYWRSESVENSVPVQGLRWNVFPEARSLSVMGQF